MCSHVIFIIYFKFWIDNGVGDGFNQFFMDISSFWYILVAVTSSGILKAKQKLGVTFNSDELGSIDFTKISKLTMCSA